MYTFMNVDDGRQPPDDAQRFSPSGKKHPEGSSDRDYEDKTKGNCTSRVQGSDDAICPTMMMTSTLTKQHCNWNAHRVMPF